MPQALQGDYLPPQIANPEIINDITAVSLRIFPNEFPLVTRLRREPVGSQTFTLFNYGPRKRDYFLQTALTATTTDPIDVKICMTSGGSADVSPFMKGDVIEITYDGGGTERYEISQVNASAAAVNADPDSGSTSTLGANSVRVRRGKDGTTATSTAAAANNAIKLLGNSRRGDEVDQTSQRAVRVPIDQYCQTWQFPVQVAGTTQSIKNAVLPRGFSDFMSQDKMDKLREMYRDMEYSTYYGGGEAPSGGTGRPKQKGLRSLISTNRVTSPTNAGSYKQTDFVRDMFQKARAGSGEVDIVLVSTDFMSGLAIWGLTPQRVEAGTSLLGTPINKYAIPLLNQTATFIEAPQLKSFTAVGLTSQEVAWRNKRNEFWMDRGRRGDMFEGDWIAEGAVHLENEAHHVWLEGITAFSS